MDVQIQIIEIFPSCKNIILFIMNIYIIVNDIKSYSHDNKFKIMFFPDTIKHSCALEQVCTLKETFLFKINNKTNIKIHLYNSLTLFAYCEYIPKNETKWHTLHIIDKHIFPHIEILKLRIKTEIKNTSCSLSTFSHSIPHKSFFKSVNTSIKHSNQHSSKNIKGNSIELNNKSRSTFRKHSQQLNNIPKVIHRRNLLYEQMKLYNNHSMEIKPIRTDKDKKILNELMLNRSARHSYNSYSIYDNKKNIAKKEKSVSKTKNKILSYERNCIGNTNKKMQCKMKSSNFRLEKKIIPYKSDKTINKVNSNINDDVQHVFEKEEMYTNEKECNVKEKHILLNEILLSSSGNEKSLNETQSILSLSQIKSKFEESKNDYNLIYTDTYFTNIENESLQLEMQLLLEKIIELQQLYHNEIAQYVNEYKQLKGTLYKYTKMFLLLKRKLNLLEEQIELDNVIQMSKNIYNDIGWVSLTRKEMECYKFVHKSKKEKMKTIIKKELIKLFLIVVTKNKMKLNNLQKKYIEELKHKEDNYNINHLNSNTSRTTSDIC